MVEVISWFRTSRYVARDVGISERKSLGKRQLNIKLCQDASHGLFDFFQ